MTYRHFACHIDGVVTHARTGVSTLQVHEVFTSLMHFCDDLITVDHLITSEVSSSNPASKKAYAFSIKKESDMPAILVSTPTSILNFVREKKLSIADGLQILVVDEADLMFSFGYEQDMRQLCSFLPATSSRSYQAMLCSATLNDEVMSMGCFFSTHAVTLGRMLFFFGFAG